MLSVTDSVRANERVSRGLVDKQHDNLFADQTAFGWKGSWIYSGTQPAQLVDLKETDPDSPLRHEAVIRGTKGRNNPLRRELATTFQEQELYFKFKFRYAPEENGNDQSEFFVFWLDRYEGSDQATHANHVPNIGVHVAPSGPHQGKVVFMCRIGSNKTAWSSRELERGRDYVIVGKLTKPENNPRAGYTRLDMWVDPEPQDIDQPIATARNPDSLLGIQWVGFSTGVKTEPEDQVCVSDLVLSRTWQDVLAISSAEFIEANRQHSLTWNEPLDFKKDIFPILEDNCFYCHAGTNPDSGYRLDVFEELRGFSNGEELVVPGKGHASKLVEVVLAKNDEIRMPPADVADPLEREQIAKLKAWIDQGAEWDFELLPTPSLESDHWAFQPVTRPQVPEVVSPIPIRTGVDAFIERAKQDAGIKPVPQADRRTLIRRLYLDLVGLLPTPAEVDAFVAETDPRAYEKLVERLLASPHYGEHWGRYWLDLTRWAESHGYQHDIPRPYAWRYRDYVIDSFNRDKPYDQFLKEQLAGDELTPYSDENLIATGFLASARISGNQMDKTLQRNDVLVDMVNVTGSAILGLTMECAQCHNHKFDPISQRDYYRLQGFFVNGQLGNLTLQSEDYPNPTDFEQWMPSGAFKFYQSEAGKLIKQKKFAHTTVSHTWGFYSPKTGHEEIERLPVVNRSPIPYTPTQLRETKPRMFIRGDAHKPGPVVTAGWPAVLDASASNNRESHSRTELADWLADPENPLVSRVWANRLWQYHFGKGLVDSPSNFGVLTEKPQHAELLDWLATELMNNGWSTRHLHRLMVLSTTYRQARHFDADNQQIDPANKLLWTWPGRRLTAEAIRDSVLCATGELNPELHGPSVPTDREEENLRRTIYLYQRRSEMPQFMSMFDAPDNIASCSRRQVSTVALQPLYLLNSDFMSNRADALANKILELARDDSARQVELAFIRTLGRSPSAEELRQSIDLLQTAPEQTSRSVSLSMLCHALMNLNEFVYIP